MRVLVCVIPQVRYPELTWNSFKTNVLDELEADLLLCVGDSRPRAQGKLIENASGNDDNDFFNNAKYIFRYQDPADWSEAFDIMSPAWRDFAHIPDGWLGPAKKPHLHGGSGGVMLFFRWFLLKQLETNNLLEKYDQIVLTRSDYFWMKPHPKLDCEHAWFPNGEFHGGLCDRHMVIPTKWAADFLGTGGTISKEQYQPMVNFFNERISQGWGHNWMYNIETYLWFRYLYAGHHTRIGFFPQKMVLASTPPHAPAESWDPVHKLYIRYRPELESVESSDDALITWPYTIEHTYMKYGMFTGRVHQKFN